MENDYIRLAIAILATFRIARLLPLDDGPLYVFERLRLFAGKKAEKEQSGLGFWHNLNDGILCAYCQGLYAAVLCSALLIFQSVYGDIFLLILALAGAQSLLQGWMEK